MNASDKITNVETSHRGRLLAGPRKVTAEPTTGLQPLGLGKKRDGLLSVPKTYNAQKPAPFVLSLHGAGGNAHHGIELLQQQGESAGIILLAPDSRGGTWDFILGDYGPDVEFIDRALHYVFARFEIDARHLAVAGFSDGASYALSLGLINGDLFTHTIAFSPGFMQPTEYHGLPQVFISHGTHDPVLNINSCSRRIVPQLKRSGYDVTYREFDGGHEIPEEIRREAISRFMAES